MRVSSTAPASAAPACNVGVAISTLSGSKSIGATGGEIVRTLSAAGAK